MARLLDTLALLFTVISAVAPEWATNFEGREQVIQCFNEMNKHGDITNLLIDVTTPEKIDAFCRRHSDLQRCIASNEHHLTVAENTEYLQKTSGVHNFYLNVCPPGTDITQEYKGNSPCFKLIKNEILSCGSDLPDMDSYKMKTDTFARCCALRAHRRCLKQATNENCGAEAAQVTEKMHARYFESQLKGCNTISPRSCGDNGHSTPLNSPTTTRREDDTFKPWNTHTTKHYDHHSTENEHWKHTTAEDEGHTTSGEERHTPDADAWKRHKKHRNGAVAASVNSVISVLSCLAAFLFFDANKF